VSALLVGLLALPAAYAGAQSGLIRLNSFPSLSVADGRSTVTISAELRDTNGSLAANGTQVVFSATLGCSFREPIVKTNNGVAHAILEVGSTPGIVRITATALGYSATNTIEYELVSDRSLLSSAKDYIEVVAPRRLEYAMDQRIIGAEGVNGEPVVVVYKEVQIEAESIQINVPAYEIRAKKARLRVNDVDREFDDLFFKLNQRSGYGTTIYTGHSLDLHAYPTGVLPSVRESTRFGVVEVSRTGIKPLSEPLPPGVFQFAESEFNETTIHAKKAVAFPRKSIQFHRAEIFVGDARVMALPLFQVNLLGSTPLLTEQILNVNDNQLAVNYPHFLSLKPGETSLLRLTTGESYGRGVGVNRGLFLNYELNWNRGDEMDGGLVFSGINRSDWSVGARNFMRMRDGTTANMQLEFPAHKSVYGSAGVSRQFDGFSMSLSGNSTRTLRGAEFSSRQYNLVVEKDPTKIGRLPLKLYVGLTAGHISSRTEGFSNSQDSAGIRARLQLQPQLLDRDTTLGASLHMSKLYGRNTLRGLGYMADFSLRRKLGKDASVTMGYNYTEDGFSGSLIGKQSLSLQGYYGAGRSSLSFFTSRSLDLDRANYFLDASYRISGLWRFSYAYTYSRYLNDSYLDYSLAVGYLFGGREFALTWSKRTKRFAIQILGAAID
jgi:hypothetical protein